MKTTTTTANGIATAVDSKAKGDMRGSYYGVIEVEVALRSIRIMRFGVKG